MEKKGMDRRHFLKSCLAGAAAGLAACRKSGAPALGTLRYDARGLPTRVLGRTGIPVPIVGIGCGSRFCAVEDSETGETILRQALDGGLYYWDTAHDYASPDVVSEERLGRVLAERREEVFLATKSGQRSYDGVMREFEESLSRLKTDRVDLYQAHNIQSLEDVDRIGAAGGAYEAFHKLKVEKSVRFIGFSGHSSAEAMTDMVHRFDFDTMLIALNHYEGDHGDFERGAIPEATAKDMGIMVIKAIRPREMTEEVSPEELIRYALSLDHVHSAVIGTDSLDVLRKNIGILEDFEKLPAAEMKRIGTVVAQTFAKNTFPWMRKGYRDGTWPG